MKGIEVFLSQNSAKLDCRIRGETNRCYRWNLERRWHEKIYLLNDEIVAYDKNYRASNIMISDRRKLSSVCGVIPHPHLHPSSFFLSFGSLCTINTEVIT